MGGYIEAALVVLVVVVMLLVVWLWPDRRRRRKDARGYRLIVDMRDRSAWGPGPREREWDRRRNERARLRERRDALRETLRRHGGGSPD